jgi:hypothetical protein
MSSVNYLRALTVQMDARTRDTLGQQGAELALLHLWKHACQTCNKPLGEEAPSLVVSDYSVYVEAALHHPSCQEPRWADRLLLEIPGTLTFAYRALTMPVRDPDDGTYHQILTVLFNPGLERVRIARDRDAQWQLHRRTHHGFTPCGGVVVRQDNPDARLRVSPYDPQRCEFAVAVIMGGEEFWQFELLASAMLDVRREKGLLMLVGNNVNPNEIDDDALIPAMVSDMVLNDSVDAAWVSLPG